VIGWDRSDFRLDMVLPPGCSTAFVAGLDSGCVGVKNIVENVVKSHGHQVSGPSKQGS
jgi:hypothetical protein